MSTPRTRSEFERRLYLLREKLKNEKLNLPTELFEESGGLFWVRSLPNGRVDFLSVSEHVRLNANMVSEMDDGWLDDLAENGEEIPAHDGVNQAEE